MSVGALTASELVLTAESPRDLVKEGLANLEKQVHSPFDNEFVLRTMFKMAEQLNPYLAGYDLIVGDDTSGRLPAILYWRLANVRRREEGLGPATLRFMSGRCSEGTPPDGLFPAESTELSRALIITEFIFSGSAVMKIYEKMSFQRDSKRIDVAALGSSQSSLQVEQGSVFFVPPADKDLRIDNFLWGYGLHDVKGVRKSEGTLHAERSTGNKYVPKRIAEARQDIQLIAKQFDILLPPVGRS